MKICIVADSHDRSDPLVEAIVEAQDAEAQAVIHCGDLIGVNTLRASLRLNAGVGSGGKAEGVKDDGERPDIQILSLRQIAPAGFLTQAFAVDGSSSCHS